MTGFAQISPWKLKQRMGEYPPPCLIDVRDFDEFDTWHPQGARCLPLQRILAKAGEWKPDEDVIPICHGGQRAREAAHRLCDVGFPAVPAVRVVEGRAVGCVDMDLPVRRGKKRIPIPRQMSIGTGLVILSGPALSFVYPVFELIGWFTAGMPASAGISGLCPLAIMSSKAPWNSVAQHDRGAAPCAVQGDCS